MGFKLPDLNDVSNSPKSSDTNSLNKDNTNTRKLKKTDSNQQESDDSDTLDNDIPPITEDDGIKDLTDDDFNEEINKELSDEDPPTLSVGKGIINTIDEYNGEYRIQVRENLDNNHIYYLDKEIVGDKYDAILPNIRAGVPIEFNYDDNKSYNRGSSRVHVINEITNLDTSQHLHVPEENDNNKDNSEPVKPKPRHKHKHHPIKTLLKWNDAIGNVLYKVIDFILRWTFYRVPFAGRFLVHTKIFWKIFCRCWSIILIALIWFFLFAGQLHVKGIYTVRNDTTQLKITNVRFDNKKRTVNMNVTNNSATYAYYYLKATIHEQGIIPYMGGKDITCEGPSVGQSINNTEKMTLQCNAPKTARHVAYKFLINNTQ